MDATLGVEGRQGARELRQPVQHLPWPYHGAWGKPCRVGLALCTEASNQYLPTVAFDGTSYVAAWADYRGDTLWDIFVTQVTTSGTVVTPNGSSVATNVRQYEPKVSIASPGGQQSLVVYSRYDTEPSQGSRRIRGRFISY